MNSTYRPGYKWGEYRLIRGLHVLRKLLYIDSSYTLSQIYDRSLKQVFEARFLDGYFDQVWSAHPLDTHPASNLNVGPAGKPLEERLSPSHVFVRGRYGRFKILAWLPAMNAALALISFVLKLTSIARKERMRVVRAGDPLLCGLIGLIVARLTGGKLVVRVNGNHDSVRAASGNPINMRMFRAAWVESRIETIVLRRADRVILYSDNHREFALRKGSKDDRIAVIRHGNLIDARHMAEPTRRALPADSEMLRMLQERPWMVHVGRLLDIKHAADCYEVLRQLAAQDSEVGLLLIGDGPLRETIARRSEADGLTDRLLFLGNINQDAIARILPRCTLALSPLTGRALAEVAFAALPIVAYDLDWQGEVVETDLTGILVPARDTTALAKGAARLLADASLRQALGAEARRRVFDLLEPQEQTRREIEAYASLGVLS